MSTMMTVLSHVFSVFRVASVLILQALGQSQDDADEHYDDCDLALALVFPGCPLFVTPRSLCLKMESTSLCRDRERLKQVCVNVKDQRYTTTAI